MLQHLQGRIWNRRQAHCRLEALPSPRQAAAKPSLCKLHAPCMRLSCKQVSRQHARQLARSLGPDSSEGSCCHAGKAALARAELFDDLISSTSLLPDQIWQNGSMNTWKRVHNGRCAIMSKPGSRVAFMWPCLTCAPSPPPAAARRTAGAGGAAAQIVCCSSVPSQGAAAVEGPCEGIQADG